MQSEISRLQLEPRLIRPVADPLGLYIRVGRNDHVELLSLIAQGHPQCFGFVFEATLLTRHRELRELVLKNRFDAILDPRTQPAATLGGHSHEIAALPWGGDLPHTVEDFRGTRGRRVASLVAQCVMKHGFTEVLAPTHLLQSSADGWLAVDCDSTQSLREELDAMGGHGVQILYGLAIPYAAFRDLAERRELIRTLRQLPIDGLWLRVEGLGAEATSNGVRNYIEGARDFAALNLPIVADGMGGMAGLAVMAFGAAGGLAHGVTFGERVDNSSWRHARSGAGFGPTRRVYVPDLDLMIEPRTAAEFLRSSVRAQLFGCRDTGCCRRGLKDMLEEPAHHFLVQRMKQVAQLGRIPLPLRAGRFLEEQVRPVTDFLVQATNLRVKDEKLKEKLTVQRKRLDALRVSLGELSRGGTRKPAETILPKTRIARELRASP
jgi:hypothetical protein